MILLYILYAIAAVFVITGFAAVFAGPKGKGIPFVPSSRASVDSMVRQSRARVGDRVVDLGSGDGRIVIAFAGAGYEAHGFEINPVLYAGSILHAYFAGVSSHTHFHLKSFWKEDLSSFDIVTVFGMTPMMTPLEAKLLHDLKPGSRVVSNILQMPNWKSASSEGAVYVYER